MAQFYGKGALAEQLRRGGHEDLPPPPEVTSHPITAPSNMAVTGLPVMPQVVPAQRET